MSDIKRLDPEYLRGLSDYADKQMSEAFGDAADEIERLRARLAEIENWVDRYAVKYVTHQHALMEIAKVLDNWREDKP